MRHSSSLLLAAALTFASAGAQTTPAAPQHVFPPFVGNPIKNAPFSATRILDYQPAPDSPDPIPVHGEEKFYRDSAGRVRSEMSYNGQPAAIRITDVTEHVGYRWTAGTTAANRYSYRDSRDTGGITITEHAPEGAPLLEGIPVRHTRTERDLTDGKQEIAELWYSPELHIAIKSVIEKVGVGTTTMRFINIKAAEPDLALFKLPENIKLEDALPAPAQASTTPPASVPHEPYMDDPKFQKALEQAKNRRLPQEDQADNWKHANKLAKGQCIECLHQLIPLQIRTGAFKDAVASAMQLEALATDPKEKFYAQASHANALMDYNYGAPKQEQVIQAEALYRQTLAIHPRDPDLNYQFGRALAMLGKFDEASKAFDRYVDIVPASDSLRIRAEHFAEDPKLATLQMAPPFRLVTSEGEEMQLDDMKGKVVLLDFWATWCGPCKETLPEVQRVAKQFAGQPLVVISISSDQDAEAWKTFVAKNDMNWPQYRDANHALQTAYGVTSIPRFFTIDTNGALQSVKIGSGADIMGDINKLVKRARQADEKKAKSTDKPATGQ